MRHPPALSWFRRTRIDGIIDGSKPRFFLRRRGRTLCMGFRGGRGGRGGGGGGGSWGIGLLRASFVKAHGKPIALASLHGFLDSSQASTRFCWGGIVCCCPSEYSCTAVCRGRILCGPQQGDFVWSGLVNHGFALSTRHEATPPPTELYTSSAAEGTWKHNQVMLHQRFQKNASGSAHDEPTTGPYCYFRYTLSVRRTWIEDIFVVSWLYWGSRYNRVLCVHDRKEGR